METQIMIPLEVRIDYALCNKITWSYNALWNEYCNANEVLDGQGSNNEEHFILHYN